MKKLAYLKSFSVVALATVVVWLADALLPSRDLIMFYLLAVVIIALKWGRVPAIAASIVSVLTFDLLFVEPKFHFIALYTHDWVVMLVFLFISLTISTLTTQVRESILKVQNIELLREKEKLQSILLSSISHDLRTPLASITATLSNLFHNKNLNKETQEELVETAYGEATRLNQLVGNLLDMTKVESGTLKISQKFCDISDLVGTALQQFSKEQILGRKIIIQIPDNLPEVSIDFTLMMKVLMNIFDNAFKFSPPESSLSIEAKTTSGEVRVEITDQGKGVPYGELDRIFEKFYCVSRPEKTPGTGLGLSICRGILEAHQGKIWAEHAPEQGLRIIFTLPYQPERTS